MMTAFDALRGKGGRPPAGERGKCGDRRTRVRMFDMARGFGATVGKVVLHLWPTVSNPIP